MATPTKPTHTHVSPHESSNVKPSIKEAVAPPKAEAKPAEPAAAEPAPKGPTYWPPRPATWSDSTPGQPEATPARFVPTTDLTWAQALDAMSAGYYVRRASRLPHVLSQADMDATDWQTAPSFGNMP